MCRKRPPDSWPFARTCRSPPDFTPRGCTKAGSRSPSRVSSRLPRSNWGDVSLRAARGEPVLVEKMHPVGGEAQPAARARLQIRLALNAHIDLTRRATIEDHEGIRAQILDDINGAIDFARARIAQRDMLGANAQMGRGTGKIPAPPAGDLEAVAIARAGRMFIFGLPMNCATKRLAGMVVQAHAACPPARSCRTPKPRSGRRASSPRPGHG